ncbi:MAG: hypothetical protein JNM39_17225 [Bdellovibrionaceae bacterium]|nr:hypothetical protein [Pseudobdellovibrionaceae bacterium]
MLWFKHFSNNSTQNQSFMGLSNELGAEGYGRLMLLIECLVGGADGIDHAPSAKLKVNVWATILKCKPKKVRTFLDCCQNHGIINFVHLENEIEVTLLNHRKLLSKSALPSGKRTTNGQPVGDQEENRKEQNSSFSSSQRNNQSSGQSNSHSNQSTFGSTDQSMPPINFQESKDIKEFMSGY